MFELFFTVLYGLTFFFVDALVWRVVITTVYLVILLPGVYSIFFGAPFLPSKKLKVETMLKLGDFLPDDTVYDLGCGDGRVIREVSKRGVKTAVGFEFSPLTFLYAKCLNFLFGFQEKIIFKNFWKADLTKANKLIIFLLKKSTLEFEKKVWPSLKNGTYVISNEFAFKNVKPHLKENGVYLYIKK